MIYTCPCGSQICRTFKKKFVTNEENFKKISIFNETTREIKPVFFRSRKQTGAANTIWYSYV